MEQCRKHQSPSPWSNSSNHQAFRDNIKKQQRNNPANTHILLLLSITLVMHKSGLRWKRADYTNRLLSTNSELCAKEPQMTPIPQELPKNQGQLMVLAVLIQNHGWLLQIHFNLHWDQIERLFQVFEGIPQPLQNARQRRKAMDGF